jgi:hypothetical protein
MPFKRKPPSDNVRRVISLGNNWRGVTTNKQGRLIQFESEQERKLILLLERDHTVIDYVSQPETLSFRDADGRQRIYTPDFQVWRTDGQIELHEVTVETRRRNRPSLQERETAAQNICQQRGWHYVLHTDHTLPTGYYYANLDFLSPFRAQTYADAHLTSWWLTHLIGSEPIQPQFLLSRTQSGLAHGLLLNTLYHLLWHDRVQMDWQHPLIWRGALHAAAWVWLPPATSFLAICAQERHEEMDL